MSLFFGESTGSESVCMSSVSPLAKGLFHRAIMQSGECSYNTWMGGVPNENMKLALGEVQSLIDALGVASIEEVKNVYSDVPVFASRCGCSILSVDSISS